MGKSSKRTSKTPDHKTDYQAWESSIAASFGGIFRDWPPACQAIVKTHYGYLPGV